MEEERGEAGRKERRGGRERESQGDRDRRGMEGRKEGRKESEEVKDTYSVYHIDVFANNVCGMCVNPVLINKLFEITNNDS